MSTRDRRDSDSDSDSDSDGWHTVIHRESLIPAIREAAHGNDFATLRTLMKEFVDAMEHKSCHCGFPEPYCVFGMLQWDFGILNPQVYQIAFDAGLLDKYLVYGSDDTATCRMTCDMIYNMFKDLCNYRCGGDEEIESNVTGTIDVLFENFTKGSDLRSFSWIALSRGEFVGSTERCYPEDLPSFVGHNIMNLVMCSSTIATDEFAQKIFLKLFDRKVPLPDLCSAWVKDTTRPLPPGDNGELGEVRYVEILNLVTPIQYIVRMGWLHALKGLHQRIPEKVKKDLSDADQHIQEFRDLLKYDAYHSNGDEILAEMERFIQEITK